MESGEIRPAMGNAQSPLRASFDMFDDLNFPVCVIGTDGSLIARNGSFIRIFDTEQSAPHLDLTNPFFPEYRRKIAIAYLRARKGQRRNCYAIMKTADDRKMPVEIFLYPLFSGKEVASILVFIHILDDKENHINRFSAAAKMTTAEVPPVYEFSPAPVIRISAEGKLLFANSAAENFIGYSLLELSNNTQVVFKSVSDFDLQKIKKAFQEILDGQSGCKRLSEIRVVAKGDTERWMNAVLYPVSSEDGSQAVEMFIEDITRIKRLEQKVTLMNRIRILGDITKGLLHSFNNIINVVLSRTQLLLQITEKESVLDGLRIIERTAIEGVRQVKRITDFIGEGDGFEEYSEESLIDILEDAAEFLRIQQKVDENENRRSVATEKVYYIKATVRTNIKLLRELILSIIFKVSQFISKKGTLSIVLKSNGSPVIYVKAISAQPNVETGENEKLFSGADVRLLAEKINVKIIEEETPDSYAIQAVIPQSIVVEKKKETNDGFMKIRGLNVMIVEDQEELRDVLQELFNNMGNRVTVFESGDDALEDFKAKQYDLLISDYGLGGITGLELAAKVKEIDENVVTVLLSGWMLKDLRAYKNVVDAFFEKPFKLDELIKGIARTIASKKK